ncbi:MAG: Rrf2 family transcriptional regulator [Gemmatimonas sp.]
MLSATSDLAIRAILVLGRQYGKRPVRADEVADVIGAPRNYLGKILNSLTKQGLVASARGPSGGFQLVVAPSELTLARVVDCFDERAPRGKCLLGAVPCDLQTPCDAHHRWTEVLSARRAPLCNTTVADLLGGWGPYTAPEHPSLNAATLCAV